MENIQAHSIQLCLLFSQCIIPVSLEVEILPDKIWITSPLSSHHSPSLPALSLTFPGILLLLTDSLSIPDFHIYCQFLWLNFLTAFCPLNASSSRAFISCFLFLLKSPVFLFNYYYFVDVGVPRWKHIINLSGCIIFQYLCLVLLMRQLKVTYVEIKFSKMNSFLTCRGAHLSKEKMYTKILL